MRRTKDHRLWLPISAAMKQPGMLDLWPSCGQCGHAVEAYGIGDMGSKRVEVWGRCRHGEKISGPDSWHPRHFDALRINWSGPTPNHDELADLFANITFFSEKYDT